MTSSLLAAAGRDLIFVHWSQELPAVALARELKVFKRQGVVQAIASLCKVGLYKWR